MSKLIILQGPPASGKTTWCNEYLSELSSEERKNVVIVSRDTIRQSTGTYWVPEREDYITVLEDTMIREALKRGFTVISDATNLNPKTIKHLEELAAEFSAEVEFKEFYVPFKVALERDKIRGEMASSKDNVREAAGHLSVGRKVLEGFYMRYYKERFVKELYIDSREVEPMRTELPNAIICDLDGTVAIHRSGRSPFDYERVGEDEALKPMVLTLQALADGGTHIIFLSGREDVGGCRAKTNQWIIDNVMKDREFDLILRPAGDRRKGFIFKQEVYENQIKNSYNIINVFEDDPKCVKMWRGLHLQCSQAYDFDENLDCDYHNTKQ